MLASQQARRGLDASLAGPCLVEGRGGGHDKNPSDFGTPIEIFEFLLTKLNSYKNSYTPMGIPVGLPIGIPVGILLILFKYLISYWKIEQILQEFL